jgi:outer membrane translocation and assembly module TamA
LEKCLPYPTLAQEIRDTPPAPKRVRVHLIRVGFDSNAGVPADAQGEISQELRSRVFERDAASAYLKDLAGEIAEVGVRGALRDRGYFKATATAQLTELWREGEDVSVAVAIRGTSGPQYRTGDIRIESTDSGNPLVISFEILRRLIPIQKGELFGTDRVRGGLEELARAYGREGYVDMGSEVDTQVDDDSRTIDMVIKIDQQMQYRVGSIEFLGVSAVTQERLMKSLPKPGDVFDASKLNEFFKVNRAILPSDVSSDDVSVKRDPKARTVAILFDFWSCPSSLN